MPAVSTPVLAAQAAEEIFRPDGWFLDNVWLIAAIPAASFVIILFFGKRFPKQGSEVGIAALGISWVLSVLTAIQWIGERDSVPSGGEAEHAAGTALAVAQEAEHEAEVGFAAVVNSITWWSNGGVDFPIGTLVDGLTVMMLLVVTSISLLVHVYSTDYVGGDRRYTHFFAFLSLFSAAMLFFVMSENIIQMIVGWELVGVCSFVLIGHWWEDQANSDAALKAFLTNRIGDVGLLIGMIILFWTAGSFSTLTINERVVAGELSHNTLLIASLCLLAAVMSKSGQFVLHTWLPDAMAGPTPVSALIHAATMVVAGIYMVARLYPVFFEGMSISGSSINALALVGAITLVGGGLLAFVQDDIKKVLAYSTISQLGYMVMALGVGAWTAALFHLFTHAFFKAGLFLGAGSVSHAVHGFDMKKDMGGMRKFMPTTFWTFLICSAALAGVFPLAGFWSKDEILAGSGGWGLFGGTGGNGAYTSMLVMGILGAALTGAYMTRTIYLTFFGEFRGHGEPHESGKRITIPLIILAAAATFAGLSNLPAGFITGSEDGWQERFLHYVEPVAPYFPAIGHATPSYTLAVVSSIIAFAGIAWAGYYYFVLVAREGATATELADGLTNKSRVARAGYTVLKNKYYFDLLYTDVIVGFVKGPLAKATNWFDRHFIDRTVDEVGRRSVTAGQFVYDKIDQLVVDGAVNAAGTTSQGAGEGLRKMQTGRVQQYAGIMFAVATVLAGIFIVII
ncbi:MAG: NADH-quinone oxidoreductase subunit L [Acidimicrobiia bacterium]|nr:NADH-quinone oxidoreductase subunit L [Acidimicrobiia bacterium]